MSRYTRKQNRRDARRRAQARSRRRKRAANQKKIDTRPVSERGPRPGTPGRLYPQIGYSPQTGGRGLLSRRPGRNSEENIRNNRGTGSTMVAGGIRTLTELGNKYQDNEMIGGLVAGTFADVGRTQANTGLAIQYNDAMYESMGRYQGNLENLRMGNTSKLMAQEADITRGLMGLQGDIQRQGLVTAGEQQRLGIAAQGRANIGQIRASGQEQRLGIQEQGAQERMGFRVQGEEQRAGIREQGTQQRMGLVTAGEQDRLGVAARGVEQRAGIRASGQEQRLGIETTGREERKNIREKTQAQRNLRRDARGAIRSTGARFFG